MTSSAGVGGAPVTGQEADERAEMAARYERLGGAGLPLDQLSDWERELLTEDWFAERRDAWNDDAKALVRAISRYEDEHPDDAICLAPLLDAARTINPVVSGAHRG